MVTILLVEENLADVRRMSEVLNGCPIPVELHVVHDGDGALAFLRRESPYASVPRPDCIMLNRTFLRENGDKVLREVRKDPQLKRIPVVVLPHSDHRADVSTGPERGENVDLQQSTKAEEFFGKVNELVAVLGKNPSFLT